MRLIDTHAHLLGEYYPPDEVVAVLAAARARGVVAVINVGTRLEDSREALATALGHADVWATAGVHPHEAASLTPGALDELERLARHPRVVAVGECGLDYHYDHAPRLVQQQALRQQVRLARAIGKPLVLHNRESDADLVAILAEEGAAAVGGVVHAFSADRATAMRCLDLGFHLGFGGMITFAKAENVREALRATPADRLLLETDAPYLTPVPHRGKRNQPGWVELVAAKAALDRNQPVEDLAGETSANACRLFRIAPPG